MSRVSPSLSSQDRYSLLGNDDCWPLASVLAWLINEGRLIDSPLELISSLARRLVTAGAPLSHLRFHFRTIHPEIVGWGYVWRRRQDVAEETSAGHGILESPRFIGSPLQYVYETGSSLRKRLDALGSEDHPAYHDYVEEGATDFVIIPLRFSDGTINALAAATDRHEGFRNEDLLNLHTLGNYLAPILEVIAARRITLGLLDTYLGKRSGSKVLQGQVRRGDGEVINAALWFSDLRDSTKLSETLNFDLLLELLNTYFEVLTRAVTKYDGEVLRYVGDAMLVIFPAESELHVKQVCNNALQAAVESIREINVTNGQREESGFEPIRFGLGLHIGEVIYGNVGATNRLDFTVMGTAVNRAARIEGLTKSLGQPLLMSSHFAAAVEARCRSLGFHEMVGVPYPLETFTLHDTGSLTP